MSGGVHQTAVVDPRAKLGRDVTIGAFSVIGGDVTLADGVEVGHHAVLEGLVEVGPGARVGHGAVLGAVPQDLKYKEGTRSGVRIGPGATIREYVTIHRATRADAWTEIGPNALIMAASHIAHDCRIGRNVIVINYAGITGHCEVGDYATFGGMAGLTPFTRVGVYAYVGGCSKVTSDVPPCLIADGQPATVRGVNVIGLRRGGIEATERRALQEAYRILYRQGLAPARALERIRKEVPATPLVATFLEFIGTSRRGICGPPSGWGGSTADPSIDGPVADAALDDGPSGSPFDTRPETVR
jgi:UDP-N-acetylglucosamine acyltransferase